MQTEVSESMKPNHLQPIGGAASPPQAPVIRVGVVEDDAGLRRNLEWLLGHTPGFSCACACGSGEEALKEVPRAKPEVILMDVHLPNRSGIECTALLKEQLPELRVIMLTVYESKSLNAYSLRTAWRRRPIVCTDEMSDRMSAIVCTGKRTFALIILSSRGSIFPFFASFTGGSCSPSSNTSVEVADHNCPPMSGR